MATIAATKAIYRPGAELEADFNTVLVLDIDQEEIGVLPQARLHIYIQLMHNCIQILMGNNKSDRMNFNWGLHSLLIFIRTQ